MLWTRNGKIIAKDGKIVDCDECPCKYSGAIAQWFLVWGLDPLRDDLVRDFMLDIYIHVKSRTDWFVWDWEEWPARIYTVEVPRSTPDEPHYLSTAPFNYNEPIDKRNMRYYHPGAVVGSERNFIYIKGYAGFRTYKKNGKDFPDAEELKKNAWIDVTIPQTHDYTVYYGTEDQIWNLEIEKVRERLS